MSLRCLIRLFFAAALVAICPSPLVADGVTGGTGIQSIPLAAGLGNSPSTFNPSTGGSQQALVQGSAAYLQSSRASKTANYSLNSDLGGSSDCARLIKANGTGSIQITAPNPVGALCTYQIADQSAHGYTVSTPGGTATFYGCVPAPVTTLNVPPNNMVALDDDGTNYFCSFAPQTVAGQVNQTQTWGPQNSTACNINAVGGVFTPSCPISIINLTASGQHIAPPNFMPPNTASTFVNLVLTYGSGCTSSSLCTPIFDGSPNWPGSVTPPACAPTATPPITAQCFSSVALATGHGDWLEGRSIDTTHVGYGSPLTNMGASSPYSLRGNHVTSGYGGSGTTQVATINNSVTNDLRTVTIFACPDGGCGGPAMSRVTSVTDGTNACQGATNAFYGGANGSSTDIWFCPQITGGSNATVTVTFSQTVTAPCIMVQEWGPSPASPDATLGNTATGTGANPSVATNGSTTQSGELVLSIFNDVNSLSASTGTVIDTCGGNTTTVYQLPASTGTITNSVTSSAGRWSGSIAAFKY